MTLIFQNNSILPLECISTFGVSVKDTDSPIGYFGTGLKYAIATLLREDGAVNMVIDGYAYHFTTEWRGVRGKEFGFIFMNDVQLPFTTELGKNWQLWQAYRELYSNCIDEGGEVLSSDDTFDGGEGKGTIIVVEGLDQIHEESSRFILRSEPKHVIGNVEIHEGATSGVFYKGIKVLDLPTKFTYNILSGLTLTEDRTVSQWDAEYAITSALIHTNDTDALLDVLSVTEEEFHEAKFNWSKYATPSEPFMRLVSKLKEKPHTLGVYYSHHESSFIGKLDRGVLSEAVAKKLTKLRASVKFKPAELFVAAMQQDYKIVDEGLVLNLELLANPKKLNFVYALACHKMANKKPTMSDYDAVLAFMLDDFQFVTVRQRKLRNSRKAA